MNNIKNTLGAAIIAALIAGATLIGGGAAAYAADAPSFGGSITTTSPTSEPEKAKVLTVVGGIIVNKPVAEEPELPVVVPELTPSPEIPVVTEPTPVIPALDAPIVAPVSPALAAAIHRQLASTPGSAVYDRTGKCISANYGTFGNGSIALNGRSTALIPTISVWELGNGRFGFQWYQCKP